MQPNVNFTTQILSAVKAPLNHPLFFSRVFALVTKSHRQTQKKSLSNIQRIVSEEFEELSRYIDRSQTQDSCSVRNMLRVRQLVEVLVDQKGELQLKLLPEVINYLRIYLYSLGPSRQYDAKRQEHILKVLTLLQTNQDLVRMLKKIGKPFSHKHAEDLIRDTLALPAQTVITDAHARRAALAAWLCYLRQNVGSCFATAPAEIVHDEQPELFLQDLSDLLATGRLKRTFGGVEYTAPLSISWGSGDLKRPIIIRYDNQGIQPEIWYAPGLIKAFEAVGILKAEEANKTKMAQVKSWLTPILQQKREFHQPYAIVTVENIIRWVMLQTAGLTEQNIRDYQNRPKEIVQRHLFLRMPQSSKGSGSMGERCATFLQQLEIAENAFKALANNALLKAWEFTLASFSEAKLEFTRWNLYASLGMGTQEPGGIGECIHNIIQRKLDEVNRKVQDVQSEYEMVYTQVKTLESRMRHTSTEKELQWIKVEYQSRANEFYFLEEQRDEAQAEARGLVNLYDTLYAAYVELFKDYFQEVYDADMQEVTTGPFDDSPAGFRLLYKHGRSNTSQWTSIKNPAEFIDALASFFVATEPQIANSLEKEGLKRDLSEVVTAIVNHIKTKEFIETAFHRMAMAHRVQPIQDPLNHLEHIEKKPWTYTSGGTMNTLVSCYYRLPDKPTEVAKWVESDMELLVFLLDTLKHVPYQYLVPYLNGKRSSMLMQSPTHAFLLKPNLSPFKETWQNEEFTYTFVRDRLIQPVENFIDNIALTEEMMQFLVQELVKKVPENFQPRFKVAFNYLMGPLNPHLFRDYLVDMLATDRGLQYNRTPVLATDEIDGLLFSHLPLCPMHEIKDRIHKILILLPGIDSSKVTEILNLMDSIPLSREYQWIGAYQLQEICKALLCLAGLETSTSYDYHWHVSQAAKKLGFAMPMPILFADTNWVKEEFGFVVNPGSGRVELWRLDYTGSIGYPMSTWREWLDGSHPEHKWGIYVKPSEYGQN